MKSIFVIFLFLATFSQTLLAQKGDRTKIDILGIDSNVRERLFLSLYSNESTDKGSGVANSVAGHESTDKGSGGGIEVCKGKVPVSRDLFEGQRRGLMIPSYYNYSTNELIKTILKKIKVESPAIAKDVWKQMKRLLNAPGFSSDIDYVDRLFDPSFKNTAVILTNNPSTVPQYNDASILEYDPLTMVKYDYDCHYEPIASWDNTTDVLTIFKPRFSELAQRDQVALLFHEVIYKVARVRVKASSSDLVRNIVAELFSTEPTSYHLKMLL